VSRHVRLSLNELNLKVRLDQWKIERTVIFCSEIEETKISNVREIKLKRRCCIWINRPGQSVISPTRHPSKPLPQTVENGWNASLIGFLRVATFRPESDQTRPFSSPTSHLKPIKPRIFIHWRTKVKKQGRD
jgi:hypothetical protein